MKNQIKIIMPEDTCSREVVSASLERGNLRAFFERGCTMADKPIKIKAPKNKKRDGNKGKKI